MIDLEELLRSLGDGRLVHLERLPARPARTGAGPAAARAGGAALGVPALWSHQAAAIDLVRRRHLGGGGHGHGVGEVALLPGAHRRGGAAGRRPPATALLLYPTKALAQDQLRSLAGLDVPGLVAATYDGDTGPEERPGRGRTPTWCSPTPRCSTSACSPTTAAGPRSSRRLRYVVVDELHDLRGIFGTHVAHLLRRLRRLCAAYGSSPTFVFCSATIGEPGRAGRRSCAAAGEAVTDDGSPRGERLFALWNPPLLDERSAGARVGQRRDGRRCWPSWSAAATGPSPSAAAGRAPRWSPPTSGAGSDPTWPTTVRPTAAATWPRSAGDRGRAVRRAPAGRGGHHRPRARRRHRRARRLRARRLPRHHRLDVAAGGAGRPAQQRVAGGPRGRRGPARPVAHGPPPRGVHPAARAGGGQPVQPVRARCPTWRAPPTSCRSPRRRALVGRRPRRGRARLACRTTASAVRGGRAFWAGRGAGVGWACAAGSPTSTASPSTTAAWSAPSTRAGPSRSCTPARSTSTRAGVEGRRARPRRPGRRGVADDGDEYTQVRSETGRAHPRRGAPGASGGCRHLGAVEVPRR